ncbi:MAG: hypothetical protein AB8F94_08775 [Saprospiraceae bacterium]
MRILTLCIFFSSLISPPSQNLKTVSQIFSVHNLTTSLITQLDGEVEFVEWEKDELLVETSIIDESGNTSDYTLNYVINKKNFELDCSLIGDARTLLLASKKINNTIFSKGQKHKTKKTFKIYLPKRLHYAIQ